MLEFGVVLANAGVVSGAVSVDELVALGRVADQAREWDYVWVGDSLLASPRFESIVLLSALATATSRIRLGLGCLASMGLRPAPELAVQWASLDVLSHGRVTLVACPGPAKGLAVDAELAAFGLTHPEKVARMDAAIDLLRRAADPAGPQGDDAALIKPGFVQRPLPIWMVANPSATASEAAVHRALTRVARLGDGWMTFGLPAPIIAERVRLLHRLRAEHSAPAGRDYPVCVYVDVNVDDDRQAAMADAVLTCRTEGRRNATPEALARTAAIGSVEACVEFIGPMIEAGVTHIAVRPVSQHPGQQVERLDAELIPALRTRYASTQVGS
jgi:alkanesulfonate monooxygenase SsuD/methylene tetrahydromethanopterin reductase-like flavin-dependent oxidoreductase (luciferase family)